MSKIYPIGIQNFEKIRRDGYFYTKFGKVSVFSALNNLIDLSMDERYAAICGMTKEKIHDNLEEDLLETSQGRIDLVLQTDELIDVMEFKREGSAEEALRQINEKNYAQPFAADPRRLFKIGINFSSQTRNIERWIVE